MPLIGKALRISNVFKFAFTLTISGTDYTFDGKSQSSSVSGRYAFVRGDKAWSLVVYANGTLTFTKLGHMVDICVVGGGGGAGGSTVGGSAPGAGYYGGYGAGGYVEELLMQRLSPNTDYTITIGSGGDGGSATSTSTWVAGGDGSSGTASSFGSLLTANGGKQGGGANTSNHGGSNGYAGQDAYHENGKYCFGDTEDNGFPFVSGANKTTNSSGSPVTATNAQGGYRGYFQLNLYGDPTAYRGQKGADGLIVIRNSRK